MSTTFQSRSGLLKDFEFPRSTKTKYIIRAKTSGIGFKYSSDDEKIDNFIDRGIFETEMKQINRICDQVYIKKRLEETGNHDKCLKVFMNIAIILVSVAFTVAIMSAFDKELNENQFLFSVILVSVASLIMFSVILYSLFKVNEFTNVSKETKRRINDYLTKLNSRHKRKFNIMWTASQNLFWIEVKKVDSK